MTTLSVRRPTQRQLRDAALWAGFVAWILTLFALFIGALSVPAGSAIPVLVIFGVPIALGLAGVMRRSEVGVLPLVAGAALALTLAWIMPVWISDNPKVAYAFPIVLVGAFAANRWPTGTFVA